jgi:hypothetical protein
MNDMHSERSWRARTSGGRRPGARVALVTALVAAAATAAAGCGGGGGDDGGSATPPPATTAGGGGAGGGGSTLQGTVGPGFDISLEQNGSPVTSLAPGDYTLVVDDQADIHNFHLTGPGTDVSTGVSEKGTKTFHVTLQAGSYHFQCDPHASSMKGDFTVG